MPLSQDDPAFRVTYNDGGFNPSTKTGSKDNARRDTSNTGATRNDSQKNKAPTTESATEGNKTAAQLAEDAKNRTIGHYVVGKSLVYL